MVASELHPNRTQQRENASKRVKTHLKGIEYLKKADNFNFKEKEQNLNLNLSAAQLRQRNADSDGFCAPDKSLTSMAACLAPGYCSHDKNDSMLSRERCENEAVLDRASKKAIWTPINFWYSPKPPLLALRRELCEVKSVTRLHALLDIWNLLPDRVDLNECSIDLVGVPRRKRAASTTLDESCSIKTNFTLATADVDYAAAPTQKKLI